VDGYVGQSRKMTEAEHRAADRRVIEWKRRTAAIEAAIAAAPSRQVRRRLQQKGLR
jgi:hypothetical protein